tara:strand:+ start:4888 stop:5154 length:267 start_codon:yes stop_codon:yes gene_type:complete
LKHKSKHKLTNANQIAKVVTINDLKDKEFSGKEISHKERLAIINYDRYRLNMLKKVQHNEHKFHQIYFKLQAEANLLPFTEFLKEKYF